jgi:hypothetical protein
VNPAAVFGFHPVNGVLCEEGRVVGDIVVGTANDTASILSVGTNGFVLKANSATTSGLEWSTDNSYSAPTLGSTAITSGATITTISGLTDIVLNGPGSVADELTLLLMGAL